MIEVCQVCAAPATVQVVIPAAPPWPCELVAESCELHVGELLADALGFHHLAYVRPRIFMASRGK